MKKIKIPSLNDMVFRSFESTKNGNFQGIKQHCTVLHWLSLGYVWMDACLATRILYEEGFYMKAEENSKMALFVIKEHISFYIY